MDKIVLTVITVCSRAGGKLKATAECILRQTWTELEYLVIDGGSEDGTLEYLEESRIRFQERGMAFRYLSEPDQGIYDAMNKSVRMASGQWLLFFECGRSAL